MSEETHAKALAQSMAVIYVQIARDRQITDKVDQGVLTDEQSLKTWKAVRLGDVAFCKKPPVGQIGKAVHYFAPHHNGPKCEVAGTLASISRSWRPEYVHAHEGFEYTCKDENGRSLDLPFYHLAEDCYNPDGVIDPNELICRTPKRGGEYHSLHRLEGDSDCLSCGLCGRQARQFNEQAEARRKTVSF